MVLNTCAHVLVTWRGGACFFSRASVESDIPLPAVDYLPYTGVIVEFLLSLVAKTCVWLSNRKSLVRFSTGGELELI